MSVQALSWVLDHSTSTGSDRLVLLSLANHGRAIEGEEGWESWPGIETITREAGLKRERTSQEALARLVEQGRITRVINGAPDKRMRADRRTNLYRIRVDCPLDGVTPERTPSAERGDGSRRDGVTDPAERGDASQQNGVTRNVTQTVSEPLLQPSVEPISSDHGFADFWHAYPRKDSKPAARKAFERAIKRAPSAVIILGAGRYASDPNRDPSYTKMAATWLNNDCWEDPPLPPRNGRAGPVPAAKAFAPRAAHAGRLDLSDD